MNPKNSAGSVEGASELYQVLSSEWLMQPELPEEDMDVRGGGAAYDDVRIDRDGYGSDAEVDSRSELSWRKQVGSPSPYRPQYKRSHVNIEAGDDDAGSSGVPSPSDIIATKRLQPSPPKSGAGQIAPQAEIAGKYTWH